MTSYELYPELHETGGLPAALTHALSGIGSQVTANGLPEEMRFVAYGRVERENRFSQVYIAEKERLFLIDFWRDGVQFASAETPDINEVAKVINSWVGEKCSVDDLGDIQIVELAASASSYDKGTEVEDRWASYGRSIGEEFPELVDFVSLALQSEKLRQLFPFTSMNRFCFSRCTGYPFTGDTPSLQPQGDGTYSVFDSNNALIGNGNAIAAVQMVIDNLPPNCGPAVRGTSETMDAT